MRYHIATGVYKRFSVLSVALIFALTSVSGAVLSVALSKIVNAAGTPSITHVGPALINASNYSGITVTLKTQHITTAENITVTVDRASGDPIVKTAKQKVLDTINTDDGLVKTVTAPIVIKNISYNEAGSESWNAPVNPLWTTATIPQSVTVSITGSDGLNLTKTEAVTGSSLYAGMVPPAPDIHSLRFSTINSTYKGIVIDQYVRNFSDATSFKATIHRADGSSVSRTANTGVLNTINSGGNKALTTPFDFAGNTAGNSYGAQSAIWTPQTKPVGVTIEIVSASYGVITLSTPQNQALVEGSNKVYANIIPNYPPTTTLNVEGLNNGLAGNTFTVSGDASAVYGLNRVYVQLVHRETSTRYGGTTINLLPNGNSAHWSQTYDATKLNLPEGNYAAHVSVVDKRGVNDSVGWTDNFKLDKTSPTFAIVTPSNNSVVNGVQRISATITDTHDIKKVLINVGDGKGNYSWEAGKNSKITRDGNNFYIDIDTKTLPNGVNHIVLRATDGAGNTRYFNNNPNTRAHSYSVDNEAPRVEITNPANNSYHNGNVPINATVRDDQGNLRHYYFKVEKKNPNNTWSTVSGAEKTVLDNTGFDNKTIHTLTNLTDGEYRVQLAARDKAGGGANTGNRSVDAYSYFTVDKTNPTVAIDPTPLVAGGTVNVRGTIADPNPSESTFTILKDGAPITHNTNASGSLAHDFSWNTSGLEDGDYTIQFTATDAAGNTSSSATRNITIDNSVPTVNTPVQFERNSNGTVELRGTIDDASSINNVTVELDGDNLGSASLTQVAGVTTWSITSNDALNNRIYTGTIIATDEAGNTSAPQNFQIDLRVPAALNTAQNFQAQSPLQANLAVQNINIFNNNLPFNQDGFVASATTNAPANERDEQVKSVSTTNNKEKEIVEAASSSFAWYWILLLIAALAAAYYAYRNWKLSSEK